MNQGDVFEMEQNQTEFDMNHHQEPSDRPSAAARALLDFKASRAQQTLQKLQAAEKQVKLYQILLAIFVLLSFLFFFTTIKAIDSNLNLKAENTALNHFISAAVQVPPSRVVKFLFPNFDNEDHKNLMDKQTRERETLLNPDSSPAS